MLSSILKNFTLFVDGVGQIGECEEFTPPKITTKMEEYRNGGMDVPIEVDMGMEKLECSFTLTSFSPEVMALYGFSVTGTVSLVARGSVVDEVDGTEKPVLLSMTGRIKEVDSGSWKSGDNATRKYAMALHFYSEVINGVPVTEIDALNFVRKIGGVDQLAARRANLGIA